MKIPNADRAVIAPEKLRAYLLNPAHRRGGPKARLLISLGYTADDWQRLEADLRLFHLTADVTEQSETDYGTCYTLAAPIPCPVGRVVTFRSVWQTDAGTDVPRLITMYPE
jgi:hypothetical protein